MTAGPLPLLIGPTASGKSAAAFELARRRHGELLSVDSMKLYKRLEIGVAKPGAAERAAVRHHLVDWKEPWESCSVAEWLAAAERVIHEAAARGVFLAAEGGTALYIKALREGLFPGPGRSETLRAALEAEAREKGLPVLYERLQARDPAAAKKILPGDERRIVRALEVLELTGKPISAQQVQWGRLREDLPVRVIGLAIDRAELYRRIDARVDAMLALGWLDECRALLELDAAQPLSREARQAIGYRTLFAVLRGEMPLAAAAERIKFDTHHFARRQLSWFRRFTRVEWLETRAGEDAAGLADRIEALLRQPPNLA